MIPASPRSKNALVAGGVRAWHVLFVLLLAYSVGFVAGYKVALGIDEVLRPFVRVTAVAAISGFLFVLFALVVPEFRRVLPVLFASPAARVKGSDIGWAAAAMLCWGYGLYRVAVLLPILVERPEWFGRMDFIEAVPRFEARFLLVIGVSVVLSPIGEELMFRGLLMNLWIAHRGRWFGVVGSSVVFGLFHWDGALFAGGLGLVYALVYLRYDSLWPGIGLHALYNATTPFWLVGGLVASKPPAEATLLSHWILEIVLAILFFPAAWHFWRRFRPRGA